MEWPMTDRQIIRAVIGMSFALAALVGVPATFARPAAAQNGTGVNPPRAAEPKKTIPEKVAPPSQAIPDPKKPKPDVPGDTQGQSLGKQLDRSNGVIQPRTNIDPEMTVPAPNPDAGTMPVIPPPGSPGNSSPVQPK
jgi:hypothetical protein